MDQETFDRLAAEITAGRVVHYGGRSAASLDELRFISDAEPLAGPETDPNAVTTINHDQPGAGVGQLSASLTQQTGPEPPAGTLVSDLASGSQGASGFQGTFPVGGGPTTVGVVPSVDTAGLAAENEELRRELEIERGATQSATEALDQAEAEAATLEQQKAALEQERDALKADVERLEAELAARPEAPAGEIEGAAASETSAEPAADEGKGKAAK